MPKFMPKDIIAFTLIIGIFIMIILKSNHSMDAVLTLVVGYYFGHRISNIDNGK